MDVMFNLYVMFLNAVIFTMEIYTIAMNGTARIYILLGISDYNELHEWQYRQGENR